MAINEIGSLDIAPPTGQTFAELEVWTDVGPVVGHLIQEGSTAHTGYWNAAESYKVVHKSLGDFYDEVKKLLGEVRANFFSGESAAAFEQKVNSIVEKSRTGVQAPLANYGDAVGGVGHAIVVFRRNFWQIVAAGHRLTDQLEEYAKQRVTWPTAMSAGTPPATPTRSTPPARPPISSASA